MNKLSTLIRVGISDLNTVSSPQMIRTSGLGSCVGVVIYDLNMKVGGMSHIMLPDSLATQQQHINEYKYADTALPILVNKIIRIGGRRAMLEAKIAGGAQMFNMSSNLDIMRIGPRNVEAVQTTIKQLNIPIISSDVGGNFGRTIDFDPETGKLMIKSVNQPDKTI